MARKRIISVERPRDPVTARFQDVEATRRPRKRRRVRKLLIFTGATTAAGLAGFFIGKKRRKDLPGQRALGEPIGRLTPKLFLQKKREQELFKTALGPRTRTLFGNLAAVFGFGQQVKFRPGRTG